MSVAERNSKNSLARPGHFSRTKVLFSFAFPELVMPMLFLQTYSLNKFRIALHFVNYDLPIIGSTIH
jgi:hypothetical protein